MDGEGGAGGSGGEADEAVASYAKQARALITRSDIQSIISRISTSINRQSIRTACRCRVNNVNRICTRATNDMQLCSWPPRPNPDIAREIAAAGDRKPSGKNRIAGRDAKTPRRINPRRLDASPEGGGAGAGDVEGWRLDAAEELARSLNREVLVDELVPDVGGSARV